MVATSHSEGPVDNPKKSQTLRNSEINSGPKPRLSSFGRNERFVLTGLRIRLLTGNLTMNDIVDTAVAAGAFKTLVGAVQAAGLMDTLKGKGPFTVFAPTDDAFGKLPAGTVADLLQPEHKEKLQSVLTYHVVAGRLLAANILKLKSAKSLQGQELAIDTTAGVKVDGATVVEADILCTNGVIHIIDSVILPK